MSFYWAPHSDHVVQRWLQDKNTALVAQARYTESGTDHCVGWVEVPPRANEFWAVAMCSRISCQRSPDKATFTTEAEAREWCVSQFHALDVACRLGAHAEPWER